jgi:ribosomal protein L27
MNQNVLSGQIIFCNGLSWHMMVGIGLSCWDHTIFVMVQNVIIKEKWIFQKKKKDFNMQNEIYIYEKKI